MPYTVVLDSAPLVGKGISILMFSSCLRLLGMMDHSDLATDDVFIIPSLCCATWPSTELQSATFSCEKVTCI